MFCIHHHRIPIKSGGRSSCAGYVRLYFNVLDWDWEKEGNKSLRGLVKMLAECRVQRNAHMRCDVLKDEGELSQASYGIFEG
jgi:hypothetical protein